MRSLKLSALLPAVIFGAFASAAAAQVVVAPAPAPYTTDQSTVVIQPAPSTVVVESAPIVSSSPEQPDPSADMKCHFAAPSEYWDCVNSHNAGQ